MVREPYPWGLPPYRIVHAIVGRVRLRTLSPNSALWIDGDRLRYPLRYGDRVTIRPARTPLTVLGYDDARRRRLFP
jgi:hypothetical protein